MINIKQLAEINDLMSERRKLKDLIAGFNRSFSISLIEVDNRHNKKVPLEELYIKKFVADELKQSNELVLNKLKQELVNIENKLSKHIDLTE